MITDLQEIKEMLDKMIVHWRHDRDTNANQSKESIHTAACYIDAYQSVRKNIFDELLP